MLPGGFEPALLASQQPQTDLLDRTATGIGGNKNYLTGNVSESALF
jgi:hypothetical protein